MLHKVSITSQSSVQLKCLHSTWRMSTILVIYTGFSILNSETSQVKIKTFRCFYNIRRLPQIHLNSNVKVHFADNASCSHLTQPSPPTLTDFPMSTNTNICSFWQSRFWLWELLTWSKIQNARLTTSLLLSRISSSSNYSWWSVDVYKQQLQIGFSGSNY